MEILIQVSSKGKMTTLRVSEATKKYLEFFGRAGETHDQMLARILNTLQSKDIETQVLRKNNVIGTKYGRLNRTLGIDIDQEKYAIVCTYNDLSPWALIKNYENMAEHFGKEWELDLEIVNIKIDSGKYANSIKYIDWTDPNIVYRQDKRTWLLLYFIALKNILEDIFNIRIYDISTTEDYLSYDLWKQAYSRNKLSMESFHRDVEQKLK